MGKLIDLYPNGPPRQPPPVYPKPEPGAQCTALTRSNWYWARRGGDQCKKRATVLMDGRPLCAIHADMYQGSPYSLRYEESQP